MRKLLEKLRDCAFWILIGAFAVFSILITFAQIREIVVSVITIAGHSSLIRGIILAPFYVFGCILIIRGFIMVLESDTPFYWSKKTGKRHDLTTLYFIVMVISYLTVFSVIPAWVQNQIP